MLLQPPPNLPLRRKIARLTSNSTMTKQNHNHNRNRNQKSSTASEASTTYQNLFTRKRKRQTPNRARPSSGRCPNRRVVVTDRGKCPRSSWVGDQGNRDEAAEGDLSVDHRTSNLTLHMLFYLQTFQERVPSFAKLHICSPTISVIRLLSSNRTLYLIDVWLDED